MSSATPPPSSYARNIPRVTITNPASRPESPALKSPRTAKFAEATAVYSPIEPSRNPFKDPPTPPTNHYMPQPQVADVGFGYVNQRASTVTVELEETDQKYLQPMAPALKSPGLKSALKSPGAPPRNLETILSPTFREEQILEKTEKINDQEQRKDLKSKIRVRWAKFIMRGVNFGCSLIVLAMIATTINIFRATQALPRRNGSPAWAPNTPVWPQILMMSIAAVSLIFCIYIFYQYWKGGHARAEKVAVYFTTFTVAFFLFSIIMWAVGAFVFQSAKNNGKGQDLWGWSCRENTRKNLFEKDINYALVCRLQNWSLICAIIEIVIEVITITIYGITFYRYYSKRRLRKTMAARDRARSDLYLAQLKMQSAPNTPGLGPSGSGLLSPRDGGWRPPQGFDSYNSERDLEKGSDEIIDEKNVRYITVNEKKIAAPKPFALSTVPLAKKMKKNESTPASPATPIQQLPEQIVNDHVPAAPGEVQYGAVSIPGAYAAPMSPGVMPPMHDPFRR